MISKPAACSVIAGRGRASRQLDPHLAAEGPALEIGLEVEIVLGGSNRRVESESRGTFRRWHRREVRRQSKRSARSVQSRPRRAGFGIIPARRTLTAPAAASAERGSQARWRDRSRSRPSPARRRQRLVGDRRRAVRGELRLVVDRRQRADADRRVDRGHRQRHVAHVRRARGRRAAAPRSGNERPSASAFRR